jgi:hypothetical protein
MLSDRFGPVIATVGISMFTLAWAIFWCIWTWRLWDGARTSRPQ